MDPSQDASRTPCKQVRIASFFVMICLVQGSLAYAQSATDNEGWTSQANAGTAPATDAPRPAPAPSAATDGDKRAARSLLDAGTIAFRQARYEDALENFLQAYKLSNDPLLLFNIGVTYERLLRLPEGVKTLEQYLATADVPNRPAAEEELRKMREHIEQQQQAQPQNTPPPKASSPNPYEAPPPTPVQNQQRDEGPADPRDKRVLPTWGFWSGLGATAVLGGVTIWSGVDTLSTKDNYDHNQLAKTRNEGQRSELRTNMLIAATGVFAVETVVVGVFFTNWSGKKARDTARTTFSPWANRSSAGLSASHSF